jgi:CTP synthase
MVSYLPIPNKIGEMKTKPTQHAVRELRSYGVEPDIIIARSEVPLDRKRKEKIAISCSVPTDNVISAPDIESIYEVPLNFDRDRLAEAILSILKIKGKDGSKEMSEWKNFVGKIKRAKQEVQIAVVGKYFDTGDFVLSDAYLSVIEALKFSAFHQGRKAKLTWLNAKDFENGKGSGRLASLAKYDGTLSPCV